MGSNCEVYDNVSFEAEPYLIKIGDMVRISSGVKFTTHGGGVWGLRNNQISPNSDLFGEVIIKNNVHNGMNVVIMPGITVGDNVIIGAGAIVTKDNEHNSVVIGVSAKRIKSIDEYYEKNKEALVFTKNLDSKSKKRTFAKEQIVSLLILINFE